MWRMPLTGNALPLVIILGPTGVGKTRLAIALAQQFNGEIIGADSRQVYRYMDIGTAKPSAAQQTQIRYHLIDLADPDCPLSLADYQDQAGQAIQSLRERGKLPFLVGGTGQYISAIEEGWSIPRVPPDFKLRAELEAYAASHSAPALHERLRQVDAISADRIHPNNVRRVIRALEVHILTGQAISKLQEKRPPPYRIITIGLRIDRARLYRRVDRRVDDMIAAGFVQEVQGLLDMGYHRHLPAMTGLGYREMVEHLLNGAPLDEAIQKTKFRTHEFIRRQDVWFRGHDNGIIWHNVDERPLETIEQCLRGWLRGDVPRQ